MIEPIYIFIDESGDAGDNDGTGQNTLYYTELALQIDSSALKRIVPHIISWRYVKGMLGEPKQLELRNRELRRFLEPFILLYKDGSLKSSAVFLMKPDFDGPYLRGEGEYGTDVIKFRNFIHNQTLKHHFGLYPVSPNNYIQAVFDWHTMNKSQLRNVTDYLCKINNLPIDNLSHMDSWGSWVLQTAGQLANLVSHVPISDIDTSITTMLEFIQLKDITNHIHR